MSYFEPININHYIEYLKHALNYSKLIAFTRVNKTPELIPQRKLLVDVSTIVHFDNKTGIQRVVRGVLLELLKSPPEGYRVEPIYATKRRRYRYARKFTLKFLNLPSDYSLVDSAIDYAPGDIYLGLDLAAEIVFKHRSFLMTMRNFGVKVYFTIYDLIPVLYPHFFIDENVIAHQNWLNIVGEADGAVCISKAVSQDLLEWLAANKPSRESAFKVGYFYLGSDLQSTQSSVGVPKNAQSLLEKISSRPSFLVVATFEPRKGHLQTLLAFEKMWEDGEEFQLIFVGKHGWNMRSFVKKIKRHRLLNQRLFWFDSISDEYLKKIYAASQCMIVASEAEGFGLPLIEASHYNIPIIARDIPVFREIVADNAIYFSGLEPEDLIQVIKKWMLLYHANQVPSSALVKRLTWAESTAQLLKNII